MKKIILLFMVFLPFFLSSQNISQNQLREYAKTAYHQKELAFGQKMSDLKVKETRYFTNSSGDTLILLMTFEEGGFIMLSANESAYPVLAYSLENDFDIDNMSSGARFFLEEYKTEVEAIKSQKIVPNTKTVQAWESIKEKRMETTKSSPNPYLLTAKWSQTKFYNQYSPADPASPSGYDGRVPNGCVAVAMAMIMYYYRFPETGQSSHTNRTNYGNYSVNFGQEHYNYDAMSDVLTTYNNEVAKLIFHCATSVNMNYAPDGSGALSQSVPSALAKYFKYSNGAQLVSQQSKGDQWITLLKKEIDNKRPVYYSGYNSSGGHAFVCDGYDLDDLFHFNMGWGDAGNGYYRVDNSDNAAGSYSRDQHAILGLYPSGNYPPYCTGTKTITSYSGTLEDGSSYRDYHNNTYCTYILSPDNVTGFNVNIQYLDTEENADILSFWNGDPNNGGKLLRTLSGTMTNKSYDFDTEVLYITFKTNGENTGNGWRLSYRAFYRDPMQCYVNAAFRENFGVFEDGSGDRPYSPNLECNWSIRPSQKEGLKFITLTFAEFDLSSEDMISIYDYSTTPVTELYHFYGKDNPQTIVCHTQGVKITFKTDNWLEKNGFKIEWRTNLATGTNEKMENQTLVFPNPASQKFYIQFPNTVGGNWNATLFDVTGRTVLTEPIPASENLHSLNVENLPVGFYWLRLQNENEGFTRKIVIQN